MRTKPDKRYCPDPKMRDNMTLYEMAYSMSESTPQDAQEAFPYLINWLFKDFFSNYEFNEEKFPDLYAYNIAYFLVYNFINREVCHKVPEVFRTKLLKELVNMNLDNEFFSLLSDIKEATALLEKSINTTDDNTHTENNKRTDNLVEQIAATDSLQSVDTTTYNTQEQVDTDSTTTTSGEVVTDTDTTNANTRTLNTKDKTTNNLTDTQTHNTSDANTSSSREVLTDYPQSTVNTSIIGTWDYASGAKDITGSSNTTHTGTDTLQRTGTADLDKSGTIADQGSGTVDDTTTTEGETVIDGTQIASKTGTEALNKSSNNQNNSTRNNTGNVLIEDSALDEREIATSESWTNMSGFELNDKQIEIFTKHDNFYKTLMRRFNNCFISLYVDEDRDGYLDPSVNLLSEWEVQ